MTQPPVIGIIMGSTSDWETMSHAADVLEAFGVAHETKVVSAHRTPKRLGEYADGERADGHATGHLGDGKQAVHPLQRL